MSVTMEVLHKFLYSAFGAAAVFYIFVRFSLRYWKRRGVLHEKPKFIFGNLHGIFGKRHISALLEELYKKYNDSAGPFIGIFAYIEPMIMILDLKLVQQIVARNAEFFAERDLYHGETADPLSMNLMQLDSEKWQNLRSKVNHCFSKNQLPKLMNTLLKVSATYKNSLRQKLMESNANEGLVINKLVDCWNIDVISRMAFGLEGDSLSYPQTKFRYMAHNSWSKFDLLKAFIAFKYPLLARLLRFRFYNEEATAYFKELINDKLLERQRSRIEHNDFLQLFEETQSNEKANSRLSRKEILAQAFSFIACGLEACNATLTFCLYELAHAPQIQQRAREEIENVLGAHRNELTFETLNKMTYLKQILYETLRIYTPHSFLLRKTLSDYEIPNSVWMLVQGQRIIIPIAAIHRDEKLYPDPMAFNPDRFEVSAMEKRHPSSFLPFGAWPRNCPAQGFVEMQLLVCLVTLLRHYKFSAWGDTRRPLSADPSQLLLKPKDQITLHVEHLKSD